MAYKMKPKSPLLQDMPQFNTKKIEPMGFAEAPEEINKNVREAAMLADLLKYYRPEKGKKQKPPRGC